MAIYYTEEERLADGAPKVFVKTCCNPKCGRDYFSTSRNTKYCCPACAERMKGVVKKKAQVRAKKRKLYDANKEINRALSKAYNLAHEIADLYSIPKVCICQNEDCQGPLELNHLDLNPFNNSPNNLAYYCKSHHKAYHDKMGDVNMVETYNEALDEAGFADEDKKHTVKIEYTMNKIKEAYKE